MRRAQIKNVRVRFYVGFVPTRAFSSGLSTACKAEAISAASSPCKPNVILHCALVTIRPDMPIVRGVD